MTVDGVWSLFGSANWDPRSLRLNFELDVEAFDAGVATALDALMDARLASARQVTLQQMDVRPLPLRLRDGVARLFSPYL
jgi:cardiolipin synthase